MKRIQRLGMTAFVTLFASMAQASAPVAFTLKPANVTATTADAIASVNPQGASTVSWLEWGPGSRMTNVTAQTSLGSGSLAVTFTNTLTNLTAGIPYQYRVVASNASGVVRGWPTRFWAPVLTLTQGTPVTNECHTAFTDPGTEALAVGFGGGFNQINSLLKNDGTVRSWGDNVYGLRTLPDVSTTDPTLKVIKISSHYYHALALRANGTVFGWGNQYYGQLTIPPNAVNLTDISAGYFHSLALRADGTVIAWGANAFLYGGGNDGNYGQANVPAGLSNVVAISAGWSNSLALTRDGKVSSWGGPSALTTVPAAATNIVAIAAGYYHDLALRNDGKIVAWGSQGGTNVPATATNVMAIAVSQSGAGSMCLRSNGTIVTWGISAPPAAATNIVSIALGYQALALRVDGTLFAWSTTNVSSAATNLVQFTSSYNQSLGLRADGSIVEIAYSGSLTNVPTAATNVVALYGSRVYNDLIFALRADGSFLGWGNGGLGLTNAPAAATNLVTMSAGTHCLGLRGDGTVVAWGNGNAFGQTNVPAAATNVIAVAAGYYDSFAVRSDGSIVGWGGYTPIPAQTNVPPSATNLVAIEAGYQQVVALRADGTVVAWGDPGIYSLTNVPTAATNVVAIAAGYWHSLALRADGTLVGWGDDFYGQTLAPPDATNLIAIAAAGNDSFALRADGKSFCWGYNLYGSTDLPPDLYQLNRVAVSGSVDTNTPGTYPLTYSLTNMFSTNAATNTRSVVIVDRTPPVISLAGNNPFILPLNTSYTDPAASGADTCGGNTAVTAHGTVNPNVLGTYFYTYNSTDAYGNATSATRTILVSAAPSVTGLNATIISTNAGTALRTLQLSALITPNGPATTVTFQYGLTTTYGGSVTINLPAGFVSTNVSVTMLANFGATYHWRATATHSAGNYTSPDQTLALGSPYAAGDINGDGIVTAAELNAVYANYLPTSPWLTLTNVLGLGETNVTFAIAELTNENYTVQYSTNLTDWYSLGQAQPRFMFTDTNAPVNVQRYYRLTTP